jgi:hypothetical protein
VGRGARSAGNSLAKPIDGAYVQHCRIWVVSETSAPDFVAAKGDAGLGQTGTNRRAGALSALSAAFPALSLGRLRPKSAVYASRRRSVRRPSIGDEAESAEFQGRDARIANTSFSRRHCDRLARPRLIARSPERTAQRGG